MRRRKNYWCWEHHDSAVDDKTDCWTRIRQKALGGMWQHEVKPCDISFVFIEEVATA